MDEGQTPNSQSTQPRSATSTKPQLEPNILAALSYAIPIILGVIVLSMEKDNKFVRFHAFQAVIFGLVWAGASAIAISLRIVLIGFILSPLINVAGVIIWFWLMWKAYNNQEYQLPVIGKVAHDQTYK